MFVAAAVLLALAAPNPSGARSDAAHTSAGANSRAANHIDHKPVDKSARGQPVQIKAQIDNASQLFAPQIYARKVGQSRYQGFSMVEAKGGHFTGHLPASLLNDGALEYFIETRGDDGSIGRAGSPQQPFRIDAFDPPPSPVAATISSDVTGADVKIDGKSAGVTPLNITLDPGSHTITVTGADGHTAEQQLDVRSGGKKLAINLPLSATAATPGEPVAPTSLSVVSEPSGAHISLDGAFFGDAPYTGIVSPGQHVIAADADGRLHQERLLVIKPGRDVQLSFVLPLLPKEPALSVESEPSGALLTLDDKERGRTPWVGPLVAGSHQLLLKLDGHRSVATTLTMPKDRDLSMRLVLPAGSASGVPRLTVSSQPSGATISIDGKELGGTPWSDELKVGEHRVSLHLDGFKDEERKVTMAAGRDADVTFTMTRAPGPGKLRIETDPSDASVSVDGKKVGNSPYTGDVEPGDHVLDVSREGFSSLQQAISLEPGQQLSLRLALQQGSGERTPPLIAVASDPPGAVLSVDGRVAGVTPIKVRSRPGPHDLRITLDGYIPRTGKVNLPDSKDFELRMAVSMKPVRGNTEEHAAPEAIELARAQLTRAAACYRQGDWKCALAAYQSAYEFKPLPDLLYNIAQTRRRAGEWQESADAYRAFLKDAPDSKMRGDAERFLAYCELQLDPTRGQTTLAAAQIAPSETHAAAVAELPQVAIAESNKSIAAFSVAPASGAQPAVSAPASKPASGAQAVNSAAPTSSAPVAATSATEATASAKQPAAPVGAPDEDTDPPVVTHTPVAHALRGQPLRLTARIVDERSDVANPQACWKNLFKTDYSCAPLALIGTDQYGVEIPGKAITDGFAYYLEAYDSSENGPARSGAPELPNAVIIDEAAPAKGAATVDATLLAAPPEALGLAPTLQLPPTEKNHLLSYISIGGAVVAAATGAGLTVHSNSLINSAQDPNHPLSDPQGTLSQARTEQTIGYVLFGAAGALIIGAIAFWNTSL